MDPTKELPVSDKGPFSKDVNKKSKSKKLPIAVAIVAGLGALFIAFGDKIQAVAPLFEKVSYLTKVPRYIGMSALGLVSLLGIGKALKNDSKTDKKDVSSESGVNSASDSASDRDSTGE